MNSIFIKALLFVILLVLNNVLLADSIVNLRVDGMACPFCAYGIEKGLMNLDEIQYVDIDFDKGIVSITASDDVDVTEEQLTELIEDAGFTLRDMQYKSGNSPDVP